jgi:ribosome maturation factor RimP
MGISLSTFKSQIELDLISKVEPVIESLNYSLRDLEVVGKGRPTIRIILDKKDDQKIGIDDCSYVHEKISPMFDLWDPFPGAYTLEISSPGEHAPLRTRQHFEEALGSKIRFETTQAIELPPPNKARKRWEAKLSEINDSSSEIVVEDTLGTHRIPFNLLHSAVWLREWQAGDLKKG